MVVGAFPAAKLGALVLKQVSKPLANLVKSRAKSSPFFRTYICMPPAQFYHWCEVKMKMWSMNLGKPVKIPKLNESMAIELGAELLGEGIIFVVAAGILVYEYARSSRKEAQKEEEREADLVRIQAELKELYFAKAQHETQIAELIRVLKMNVPSIMFTPESIDQGSIPMHHRHGFVVADEKSTFDTLKGWLWSAVDVILPEIQDDNRPESAAGPIVVQIIKKDNKEPPSGSTSDCDCPIPIVLESKENKSKENSNPKS